MIKEINKNEEENIDIKEFFVNDKLNELIKLQKEIIKNLETINFYIFIIALPIILGIISLILLLIAIKLGVNINFIK